MGPIKELHVMRASVLSPFFRLTSVITMAAVVAGLTVAVSAAPPVRPGPPARPTGTSVVSASARVRAGAMSTIITGSAWTSANAPIPGAQLQLRNIENGKVVAHAVADEAGRFAFTDLERGSYLVELVNDTGKVLAIGHMFSIAPGETGGDVRPACREESVVLRIFWQFGHCRHRGRREPWRDGACASPVTPERGRALATMFDTPERPGS